MPIDSARPRVLGGSLHRLAAPQYDRGPVDPGMPMHYMMLLTKPTPTQQTDLEGLLADQQNPSSPQFHKWLTPEEFGNRFGLSAADHGKIAQWLTSEGFTVNEMARGRNWVAFSGAAGQVSRSLHTTIHRFEVNGESHYANASDVSVPEALADVVGGFVGLNDFKLKSMARPVPDYNSGTSHYLVPEDYATIYNIAPLYQAGLNGAGTSIAVVGESDVLLSDLQAFKTRYNLPANNPKMVLYNGIDPGFNGAELEGNLDLEWSSAIAPMATIYYVYGASAFSAMITAINANYAPIITISYGFCEIDYALSAYRSIAQQGNAQGITLLAASGDSGAAGCDSQDAYPFAEHGQWVDFPAVMPEVTGMGGTQFAEGTGTYWATTNSSNFGSALSYIPEAAWNESASSGLNSSGGGASVFIPKPAWQNGPGVPNDNARHVPDIALSSAGHDAYYVSYLGGNVGVFGTSASAPSMAGIVALLNQYQVMKGFQSKPGLGNINPQLYRLAQSQPSVFHDTAMGDNIVPCSEGSPSCSTGSYGYRTASGYDMVTGLGSVDANALATQWNTQTSGVSVTLSAANAKPTANDTVQLTATVVSASGKGTPTGTVAFSFSTLPLGSATVASDGTASVSFPAYVIGPGTLSIYAQYSGDAAFTGGGASARIQILSPVGSATIIPSFPNTVWPSLPDAQGSSWLTTITLREVSGVAAMLTGFTIDGKAQPIASYFPVVNITPDGTISSSFVLRNLATPLTHTYGFTGTDAAGQSWSRQVSVNYNSTPPDDENVTISATPAVVVQDTTADPSCQWPVQLHLDDIGGYINVISTLISGGANVSSQIDPIFGTTRVDAYGSVSGTLCFGGITPPATQTIEYLTSSGAGNEVTVTFAGPPASPARLTATPATVSLAGSAATPAQATLALGLSDKTQPWTVSVYPANRTTSWLTLSQYSGTGPVQITVTASAAGFEPGVYRASLVLQCLNAVPQSVTVPLMYVLGGSTSGTAITAAVNSASYQNAIAPGELLTIFGTSLANTAASAPGVSPLPYTLAGVSATINGVAATMIYVSPGQLNVQVPYSTGAGPAVLGVNNNGQIAGFAIQVAPAAPAIFSDGAGNVVPTAMATAGSPVAIYLTGAGEVTPALKTAWWEPSGTLAASLPKPVLPLSVTVGGTPAFLLFYGLPSGTLGTTQVNFTVPATLAPGIYPVVVTVNGVQSPPLNLTVVQGGGA